MATNTPVHSHPGNFPPSQYYGKTPSHWMRHSEEWPSPWMNPMTPFNGPSAWNDFDRSINHFERELDYMRRAAEREFTPTHPNKPYSTELCNFPSRPSSLLEHYSFLNPIRIDVNGNRWLNCCFDLRSFKPEEIKVTLSTIERCIHVEAQHEVKDTKEHYVRRHYNRKWFIPEDLKVDLKQLELKSYLTTEGLLYVEAPLPKMSPEEMSLWEKRTITHPYGTHFGFAPISTTNINVKHI